MPTASEPKQGLSANLNDMLAVDLHAAKDAYVANEYYVAANKLNKFEADTRSKVSNLDTQRVLLAMSAPLKEWMRDLAG